MNVITAYLKWLQKDNPTGTVDKFPELRGGFETSVPGIYCVGDLTGIPLIKLASESGYALIEKLVADEAFKKAMDANADPERYDLVIVGAGPAGVAACLRAGEQGLRHVVIEASQPFNTVHNFPAGKPIYVTPPGDMKSDLKFSDGTKESLLDELDADIAGKPLPLRSGETVTRIVSEAAGFTIETDKRAYKALRVVIAIGKTGNARRMDVPGEDLPKVYTRLIDPREHKDEDILVVGGGDSAIEAAVALAEAGNRITLSYRKPALSRPKEHNLTAFNARVRQGLITPEFESKIEVITEHNVTLGTPTGLKPFKNDAIYSLIGTEIPIAFFKRSAIKMEGERDRHWWLGLAALLSFFTMLYFGKSGQAINVFEGQEGIFSWVKGFLTAPAAPALTWTLTGNAWYSSLNFILGWAGCMTFMVSGVLLLISAWGRRQRYLDTGWHRVKYGYLAAAALTFLGVYMHSQLMQNAGWVEAPTFWYSLFYTTTIILFGLRRMIVKPTPYIVAQTTTLMVIQTLFLFVIPFLLFDRFIAPLFPADGHLLHELFPSGKWSSFAYVLFWPLNINEFGNSAFWTWFPFVQTFGILFIIVYLWGKGAYCGWICSCGAMAETLGDEYRTLAPHGPRAKRLENIGQVVLWLAVAAALLYIPYKLCTKANPACTIPLASHTLWYVYKLVIDVVFAGVLGLGVYFFLGGRIWCRYGCPLAALMHLYARFSPYRIMSNKKRCISCNICTKVCHMGIDVMNFANKGIPMNDVECVRCSACIVNCPMQVLTFGNVGQPDPDNTVYQEVTIPLKRDWSAGLPRKDLDRLLELETETKT